MSSVIYFPLLLFAIFPIFLTASSDHSSQITLQEKSLIKQLRGRLKDNFTQPIMSEDGYLIRFLRANNLNLGAAVEMMHRNLAWRKEENMDTIFAENWSAWIKRYPFSLNMHDREGRVVLTCGIGQIDPRRLILAGKQQLLDRYLVYGYERGLYKVQQAYGRTGYNTGYVLFNMAGYSPRTHACLACIPSWVKLILNYERYYPLLATEVISINTPRIFQTLLDILQPYFSSETAKILVLYDYNKDDWRRELLKRFSEAVLTPEFGGKGPTVHAISLHDQDLKPIIYYNQTIL